MEAPQGLLNYRWEDSVLNNRKGLSLRISWHSGPLDNHKMNIVKRPKNFSDFVIPRGWAVYKVNDDGVEEFYTMRVPVELLPKVEEDHRKPDINNFLAEQNISYSQWETDKRCIIHLEKTKLQLDLHVNGFSLVQVDNFGSGEPTLRGIVSVTKEEIKYSDDETTEDSLRFDDLKNVITILSQPKQQQKSWFSRFRR